MTIEDFQKLRIKVSEQLKNAQGLQFYACILSLESIQDELLGFVFRLEFDGISSADLHRFKVLEIQVKNLTLAITQFALER